MAAMGAYHKHLGNHAFPSLQAAPAELKPRGLSLHQEALALVRQERVTARHIIEAAFQSLRLEWPLGATHGFGRPTSTMIP